MVDTCEVRRVRAKNELRYVEKEFAGEDSTADGALVRKIEDAE